MQKTHNHLSPIENEEKIKEYYMSTTETFLSHEEIHELTRDMREDNF